VSAVTDRSPLTIAPMRVIDDFDVARTLLGPRETDAPLIVDPDRVLPLEAVVQRDTVSGAASPHSAVQPPSTMSAEPVISEEASLARKMMAPVISSS
jgi:hypothetical protein